MADSVAFLDHLFGPQGGNSTSRAHKVVAWARSLGDVDGKAFWEVMVEAWLTFDLIPHKEFVRLFKRFATSAPSVDLPESMTVYRGQSADAPKGLSWTLNRAVAESFARGHRGILNRNPVVLELEVTRDQVAMFINDRDEDEVVLKSIPARVRVERLS